MPTDAQKKLALTIALIACPNCSGQFRQHKSGAGIANIRCEACGFEALFHITEGGDRSVELAFTIEKEDAERLMAEKVLIPPVILYWSWQNKELGMRMEAADLYPFIPYTFLHAADVSLSLSGQPNHTLMFLQSDDLLPKMRIYNNPSDDTEIAEIASTWPARSTSVIQRLFDFGYSRAAKIVDMANEIRRRKGIVDESDSEDEEE